MLDGGVKEGKRKGRRVLCGGNGGDGGVVVWWRKEKTEARCV